MYCFFNSTRPFKALETKILSLSSIRITDIPLFSVINFDVLFNPMTKKAVAYASAKTGSEHITETEINPESAG